MSDTDKRGHHPASKDDNAGSVISLEAVRHKRAERRLAVTPLPGRSPQSTERITEDRAGGPDLAAIAGEPSYAGRRRKLAAAMTAFCGTEPDERLLDHQMIASGLAAGHGCGDSDDGRAFANPLDDPAVVIGLVLYYAKRNGSRGLPMPSSVLRHLERHVAAGSAAARLVRDWLRSRTVQRGRRQLWVHQGGKA